MSRCIHVYPFVARNHGGIPFSGVCTSLNHQFPSQQLLHTYIMSSYYLQYVVYFLNKNLNASRPPEHPPVRGENVKTFRLVGGIIVGYTKPLHGI